MAGVRGVSKNSSGLGKYGKPTLLWQGRSSVDLVKSPNQHYFFRLMFVLIQQKSSNHHYFGREKDGVW